METILPLSLLEPILSVLTGGSGQNLTELFNATATDSDATIPSDIWSLFSFIASSKAVHDYFKLIVLGSAFETLRRLYYSAQMFNLASWIYVTAVFESDDSSFGAFGLFRNIRAGAYWCVKTG
jgi:chaperone BCS1